MANTISVLMETSNAKPQQQEPIGALLLQRKLINART